MAFVCATRCHRRRALALILTVLALSAGRVGGEEFPSRPISLLVPFAAGGPTDTLGRILAEAIQVRLGRPVAIENVSGAAGSVAMGRVAQATPDGYTIGIGHWGTNVLNGAILAECKPRHRHQEFLGFLRSIDKAVPAELDVHCIVDNYASHKHPKVKAWLAARPRWHMHFIPTYSSWLNQVERFFSIITDKAIRRGSFASVNELVAKIDHFVTHYNQNCKPFIWTATADSILAKLGRLCERISGTGH